MTITLVLTPGMEAALTEAAARQGVLPEGLTPEGLTEQQRMDAWIAGLKDQPVPQLLDEIKPRRLPPPGKTAMQMVYRQLPAEESDKELQAALKVTV